MRILSHTIYTVLTGLVFIIRLTAQPAGIEFGKISLEQGLSQSTVTSIVQDARGFMWFGTQDGLNRYDGYNIKVFLHNPDDSNSISDNGIWCLLSDSRGDLWIGTERGGLNRYIYSENKFYHFTNKLNVPFTISDNYVLCLFEDSKHNIWAGTQNGGLNLFNRSTQTFTHFSFSSNSIRSITEDNNGNLWAATGQGLIKFSLAKLYPGKFDHFSYNALDPNSLSSNNINNIFFDKNGLLWIGTWGAGINTYDTETSKFNRYLNDIGSLANISHSLINSICETSTTTEKGIWIGTYDGGLYFNNIKNKTLVKYLDENVLTLYEDKSGILWVGTFGNGVRILDKQKHKFVHHYDNPDKTGDQLGNPVISILSDKDDELWVATLGNALTRYDRYRKKLTRYTIGVNSTTAKQTYISTLSESSDGTIWIGTFSGGLYSFDEKSGKFKQYRHNKTNNSPISNDISTLEYDKKSNILWLGYLNGGISSFDLSKKLFKHFYPDDNSPKTIPVGLISAIYTGNKTGLWVGIAEKGVARFIEKNNYFKIYLTKSSQPEFNINNNSSLTNNYIFSIYEDDDGLVWFGTKGGGLNRYDPVADSFTNFTVKDGLPNDVVYGIEPDKNGSLWLSTNKGLSKFNPKTGEFRNYDKNDGLQSNEFSEQAHFVSSRGEIFFGGVNGFNTFFPDEIEDNKYIPPVYLTDFKIFDESRALPDPLLNDKPIELSHSQNFFSFEFVALNYTLPEKNRYAYMLEGFDKEWHYVTATQRQAIYTNLDPGKYILRVRGSNNDGIWNYIGASVKIIVKPPFWMTLWFQVPVVLFVLMILILLYRFRVKKLLEVERIRSSIALDLHDDIGSTLTEIALYSDVSLRELRSEMIQNSLNGSYRKIENLLENIGKTSRRLIDAMNDIVWAVDPKNDSFESFLFRIKTQTAQMLGIKGIDYKFDIQDKVSNLRLPLLHRRQLHLIFKEALNNVIRHAQAKNVAVKMKKEGQSFVMTIKDDGVGIKINPEKKGNGLSNMKKRASLLNGVLEIVSSEDEGTKIELTIDLGGIN